VSITANRKDYVCFHRLRAHALKFNQDNAA